MSNRHYIIAFNFFEGQSLRLTRGQSCIDLIMLSKVLWMKILMRKINDLSMYVFHQTFPSDQIRKRGMP